MSHIFCYGTRVLLNVADRRINEALRAHEELFDSLPPGIAVGPYACEATRRLFREVGNRRRLYVISSGAFRKVGLTFPPGDYEIRTDNVRPQPGEDFQARLLEEEATVEEYWRGASAVVLLLVQGRAAGLQARCAALEKRWRAPVHKIIIGEKR